jgi:hypothetical protein
MASVDEVLRHNLDNLKPDELLQSCKAHRKFLNETLSDIKHLQTERNRRQRVCSFPDSISSIRADIDSPEDTSSFLCFGDRPKFSTIIAFKPGHYLEAQDLVEFQSELKNDWSCSGLLRWRAEEAGDRVIFSRLPSRKGNIIYVFVESSATGTSSPAKKYRLSTKATPPDGFVTHWTIHLSRLDWIARVKIWTGQIKWVYILVPEKSATEKSVKIRLLTGASSG